MCVCVGEGGGGSCCEWYAFLYEIVCVKCVCAKCVCVKCA